MLVQTDTDSDEAPNSATEISTDSEFENDPINHDPPKIFIDDSHLQKRAINYHARYATAAGRHEHRNNNINLNFKPLVEVDPTIVKREPLKNPLPGNYLLNKTASTEGIASKKSLELKKRYLLGGEANSNSSILKSDSASALDTKFKSFASNISECQKLLNPANEISPSMQTFLQRIDRNNDLNRSQHSIVLSKTLKDKYNNNSNNNNILSQDEKENRSIDSNKKPPVETVETINTALIESKIREIPPEVPNLPEIIETIDLTTPEKQQPIVDLASVEIPENTINDNKQFIENMEKSTSLQSTNMKIKSKLDTMFIDLTMDSPPKEQNGTRKVIPDVILSNNGKNEDENVNRPRSPIHETTIEVPQLWAKPVMKEIETDSLSGSSTSSLEDIPHYILDSATSTPETQNDTLTFTSQQPPRLEVRDTTGELMQIDSLMIIDGEYIGDPEDLPLFKQQQQQEEDKQVMNEVSITSLTKPLKFDTKNENKLESLKNLPLIVSQEELEVKTPVDNDKTPTAAIAPKIQQANSDEDEESTAHGGLTETELSDWSADDAVSENFMDVEFALNSGKGTIRRNRNLRNVTERKVKERKSSPKNNSEVECGILKNLAIEEIDFMDTGSEAECNADSIQTVNKTMYNNRGYVEFVDNHKSYNVYEQQANLVPRSRIPVIEAINVEVIGNVDYIEQGAYLFSNHNNNELNEPITPMNEEKLMDSLDIDEDSLLAIEDKNESLPTLTTTTETTEELTIVTSPSMAQNEVSDFLASDTNKEKPCEFERGSFERASSARISQRQIDEMGGYEEYVKSLQMKIAQISSGRDSLEKKSVRKLSKNESSEIQVENNEVILKVFDPLPKIEPSYSLSKKLEELTKERTKQKDIIHDLVMNKLQAKKQLNSEKRLSRSKNRSLYMNSGSPVSNCSTSTSKYTQLDSDCKEEPKESVSKVMKSQSFAFYSNPIQPKPDDDFSFKTPVPPPRNRLASDVTNTADKMREEARARARLKSNEDLGLSPEDKILLLRKKYNLTLNGDDSAPSIFANGRNQSDDMKSREKKLSTSKSFNDISRLKTQPMTSFSKPINECLSDPNIPDMIKKCEHETPTKESQKGSKSLRRDSERRKSLIQTVSDFFGKKRESTGSNKNLASPPSASKDKLSETSSTSPLSVFSRFRLSPKSKESTKEKTKEKETISSERSRSVQSLKPQPSVEEQAPPVPPLPANYRRSDDEDISTNETKNELKKLRAMSKASKQAELKRLRIAQEIKREQDEIDMKIKDLETRGVKIEKLLRGEDQSSVDQNDASSSFSSAVRSDEELLKELLDIWRNITQLKKRDEELIIRQQELQLEHRHAQLKEELSIRLSCSKLDKSAQDVAAEGAILTEMLELVAKRAALRPSENLPSLSSENVSLPVLPPQTTINPLLQQQSPSEIASFHPRSSVHHTFSSQSHNQEHDI